MVLTVEHNPAQESVEMYFDEEGLNLLIDRLSKLKKHVETGEHDHLMTPAWAGWELTEQKQGFIMYTSEWNYRFTLNI